MEKKKNGNGVRWTETELKILKELKRKRKTSEEIANELKKHGFYRSIYSVKHKYTELKANGYKNGDGKKKTWTEEEEKKLKQLLQTGTSLSAIYNHHFSYRSKNSIRSKIKRLDNEFLEALLEDIKAADEEEKKMWQEIYDLLTKDETEETKDEGGKKPKKPRLKLKL